MATLSAKQRQRLDELDRAPIFTPAEIYFGGNEVLQKKLGMHHLPEFRQTGTFNHPEIIRLRLRVAKDRLGRAQRMMMSDTEKRKFGEDLSDDQLLAILEANLLKCQKDYMESLGSKFQKEVSELGLKDIEQALVEKKEEVTKTVETTVPEKAVVVTPEPPLATVVSDLPPLVKIKKKPGRPAKTVEVVPDPVI